MASERGAEHAVTGSQALPSERNLEYKPVAADDGFESEAQR
jgi:hypothetical protein